VIPSSVLLLSVAEVRGLFQELAQQRMATTGNDSNALVLVALLALVSGGAFLGVAAWRRRTAA
jgi:hypothetical protein